MKTVINAVKHFKAEWMGTDYVHPWIKYHEWKACIDELSTNYGTSCTYADYKRNYTTKPAKPIYTQSMADEGVLPSAGMSFIDTENWHDERFCLLVHGDNAVYMDNGKYKSAIASECQPIDTRTDTEKAVDDMAVFVGNCESDFNIINAIKNGKIHGVTFTGE